MDPAVTGRPRGRRWAWRPTAVDRRAAASAVMRASPEMPQGPSHGATPVRTASVPSRPGSVSMTSTWSPDRAPRLRRGARPGRWPSAMASSWWDSCPSMVVTRQVPRSSEADAGRGRSGVLPSALAGALVLATAGTSGRSRVRCPPSMPHSRAHEELEAHHGRHRVAREAEHRRARTRRAGRRRTAWPVGSPPASTAWSRAAFLEDDA